MTIPQRALIFSMVLGTLLAQSDDPWAQPRDIARFQFLVDRSPFSLPTAEESSPLADRFTLTGAMSLNGEPQIFVLDKTTQERHLLSKTPNKLNMGLVEYLPDPDPRHMRATIRVNDQTATITFSDTAAAPGQQPGMPQNAGMVPPQVPQPGAPSAPQPNQVATNGNPQMMPQPNGQPPQRRVIRRRIISGQAAPGP